MPDHFNPNGMPSGSGRIGSSASIDVAAEADQRTARTRGQTAFGSRTTDTASEVISGFIDALNETAVTMNQNLSSVSAAVARDAAFEVNLTAPVAAIERDLRAILSQICFGGAPQESGVDGRTLDTHTGMTTHTANAAGDEQAATDENTRCTVCLEPFETGDEVRLLPCFHKYHKVCIDPHLLRHGPRCPICRHNILQTS